MAEVLKMHKDAISESDILNKLGLKEKQYILLSAHREENIDIESNFYSLMEAVNSLARHYEMPVLYSCHPRSEKYISARGFEFDSRVIKHKPLGFFDYNKLQENAFCIVSDSGTLPEESASLHFPQFRLERVPSVPKLLTVECS